MLTFSFHDDGTAVLSAMGTGNVQSVEELACANGADACTCLGVVYVLARQ